MQQISEDDLLIRGVTSYENSVSQENLQAHEKDRLLLLQQQEVQLQQQQQQLQLYITFFPAEKCQDSQCLPASIAMQDATILTTCIFTIM